MYARGRTLPCQSVMVACSRQTYVSKVEDAGEAMLPLDGRRCKGLEMLSRRRSGRADEVADPDVKGRREAREGAHCSLVQYRPSSATHVRCAFDSRSCRVTRGDALSDGLVSQTCARIHCSRAGTRIRMDRRIRGPWWYSGSRRPESPSGGTPSHNAGSVIAYGDCCQCFIR